jgi:phage protein Gp37/Gp68
VSASKIEWTEVTWNPTTGCDRISPGCDHCYAMTLARRSARMAFLDSMSDVVHAHVTPEFLDLRNHGADPPTHISDLDQAPPSDARPIGDRRVQTRHARGAGQSPQPWPGATRRGDTGAGSTGPRLPDGHFRTCGWEHLSNPTKCWRTIYSTAVPALRNPPRIAAPVTSPPAGERHYWPRPAMDATQTASFFAARVDSSDESTATDVNAQTSTRKPVNQSPDAAAEIIGSCPDIGTRNILRTSSFQFVAARTPASGLRRTGASNPAATVHAADLYATRY